MTDVNEIKLMSREEELAAIKHTNTLFLNLLYNLSRYPHTQMAKKFVRMGLFEFETEIFVSRTTKTSKSGKRKVSQSK